MRVASKVEYDMLLTPLRGAEKFLLYGRESFFEVGNNIVDMLDAHRYAHQTGYYT